MTLRRPSQPSARSRTAAGAAVVLLLALAAACGGGEGQAGAEASPVPTTAVDLPKSYRFAPAAIAVEPGATVTWTNHDAFTHTIAFDGAEPQLMRPGETTTRTFDEPGTFAYLCSLHPTDMRGSVLVTDG